LLTSTIDASEALILNLSLTTHFNCHVSKPFHLDIEPSDKACQQTLTISLPPDHTALTLIPTAAGQVNTRQSKLFVTVNGERLLPNQQLTKDQIRPVFEAHLKPGINRIETEIIAGPVRGTPKATSGQDIDLEKITVFAYLQKPVIAGGYYP
jgi:chromatin structure-remodeling complex subunit RSC4